jgi:hypothetical protein
MGGNMMIALIQRLIFFLLRSIVGLFLMTEQKGSNWLVTRLEQVEEYN